MSKKQMRSGRLIVEQWTSDPADGGVLVKRDVGPTRASLLRDHAYGKCWTWCSFCIADAERYMKDTPNEFNPHVQV